MYCNQCGTKLEEGTKVCISCGNRLEAEKTVTSSEAAFPQYDNVNLQVNSDATKKKVVGAVLILALVAIISVVAYNLFLNAKPISTVNKFVSAINERDFNKFSACIDPALKEDIAADAAAFSDTFKDVSLKVLKVNSEVKTAEGVTIVVEMEIKQTSSDGKGQSQNGPLSFNLKKSSKGWVITGLDE